MTALIRWLEVQFATIPLPLMEVWGRLGFLLGLVVMIAAFGGFTFRPGGQWGFGRERQAWDAKALLSSAITCVLIVVCGYIGSFIVLVPGAQTFESLKDLVVFLCILLFGYPALIVVPFAYGCSDLIEGVPPGFLLDWLVGYFINPACFWIAYQLIGKNPDFRRAQTWALYLLFVAVFMALEPELWGYICAGKFTSEISYRVITPALFFTTIVTWTLAPMVMLAALPLARHYGMFWAEIPGHVKERLLGRREWVWESGLGRARTESAASGLPIRVLLATPFIALVLVMVGLVAYLTLRSGEDAANKLAIRLHQEISDNINLRLDTYLAQSQNLDEGKRTADIEAMLVATSIAKHGRAFILNRAGQVIASSKPEPAALPRLLPATASDDLVVHEAARHLMLTVGDLANLETVAQFGFDIVTAKPLSREGWLAQATPYQDNSGRIDWIEVTAMPAAYFLEGVRVGNSQSAMVLAAALALSLLIALLLAGLVTTPIGRLSASVEDMAHGDLAKPVAGSQLLEFASLSRSINNMAAQLKESFGKTRSNEERLHLATYAGHIGIWDWDIARNELTWDDSMYALYGVQREDFGGAYDAWSRTLHPDDRPFTEGEIQAALTGEREYAPEFRIIRPDGTIRYIKAVGTTFRDAGGKALRMLGTNVDITERKLTEQELNGHRQHLAELVDTRTKELSLLNQLVYGSLESATVGAWWIDFTEQDTYHALDTTAKMIGVPLSNTADKAYRLSAWMRTFEQAKAVRPEYTGLIDAALEQFAGTLSGRHGKYRAIYPVPGEDGTVRWIDARAEVSVWSIDRQPLVMTGTLIDITSQKLAEDELRVAHERAEAGNKAKSSFLANMSHELRTPLNAILGFAQLMSRDATASPTQRDNLAIIHKSGEHLLTLINNVLDLAKIEAGKTAVEAQDFDLGDLTNGLIAMLRLRAEAKGLRLVLDQSSSFPRLVRSDPAKLRQVLINLIGNAIKFTQIGQVTIRMGNLAQADEQGRLILFFEIADTGPGISRADLGRIFHPFEQGGHRTMVEGSGLGLAITREFITLLGGSISVTSEPGQGSCFRFTIACGLAEAGSIPSVRPVIGPVTAIGNASTCRLLIVEDQAENRLLLHRLLAPLGFQVQEALNGLEAIAAVKAWHPHLVFMDWRMPVMDGVSATMEIRRLPDGSAQPIIVAVTAHAFKEERQEMLAAGCTDFLAKPFSDEDIFTTLAKHLPITLVRREPPSDPLPARPAAGDFPAALRSVPLALCRQIHEAAIIGDITQIEVLIADQPALRAAIKPLLDSFSLQPIIEQIQLSIADRADSAESGGERAG